MHRLNMAHNSITKLFKLVPDCKSLNPLLNYYLKTQRMSVLPLVQGQSGTQHVAHLVTQFSVLAK